MDTPIGSHNIHEFLSAFADGELDPAQNLAVLDYLETHPEAFDYLRDRQRLRQSAQRIALANEQAHPFPSDLKERLNKLAVTEDEDKPTPPMPPSASARRRWWQRRLGMIAASVAVGLLLGLFWDHGHQYAALSPSTPPNQRGTDSVSRADQDFREAGIPLSQVNSAAHFHVDCSRLADRLHAGGYPADMAPLSELVKADLRSTVPEPDLSSIGYHYVGADQCAHPLESTVHLLYRKSGPEPTPVISVFVQANHGQFNLKPDRLYQITAKDALFPMCAWRTNEVVYFLIADDDSTLDAARRAIPSAPSPNAT